MKRVNLYLISAALLTGFLTSCNDMENFDNNVFVDNLSLIHISEPTRP